MGTGTILVIGATGGVGRHVVRGAVEAGLRTRALVRSAERAARLLPARAEIVEGEATRHVDVVRALEGADGVILTHGTHGTAGEAEAVDYGIVRALVEAAQRADRPVRVTLMTQLGVTRHGTEHDRDTGLATWKHRSERLLRASGLPYAIVRPGWFDYEAQDERRLVARQGDDARDGTPSDGAVSREQLARVLLAAQASADAVGRTFELVAERGAEQTCLDGLFAPLHADGPDELDGVLDPAALPLHEEPARVLADLRRVAPHRGDRIAG
jgi:uncharacterized protein YbjT (DUF2867 family)